MNGIGLRTRFAVEKDPTGKVVIYVYKGMNNRRGKPPMGTSQNRNAAGRGRAAPSKNPRPRPKGSESDISPGTVTLTKKQLDSIMDTVGSLMAENQLLQGKQLDLDAKEAHNGRSEESENIYGLANNGKPGSGRSFRGPAYVEPEEVPGLGRIDAPTESKPRVPSSRVREVAPVDPPTRKDIPKAHMTKAELKRLQWEQERVENAKRDAVFNQPAPQRARQPDVLEVNHASPTNQPLASIPKANLSKAELKRLQWDRERVEMENLSIHGDPSRDMSKNKGTGNVPLGNGPPYEPSYGMSKMEKKRQQWEQEREENADNDRRRDMTDHTSSALAIEGMGKGGYESKAPSSKGDMKRRQWEQEKAENADMERQVPSHSRSRNGFSGEGTQDPKRGVSKGDIKREQWEKERVENDGVGSWQIGGNEQPRHGRRAVAPPHDGGDSHYAHSAVSPQAEAAPANHLSTQGSKPVSKGELKRLQWEKERKEIQAAEQQGEYDPWGRPGAGAPIRDPSGQVITDYNQRKVSEKRSTPSNPQAEPLMSKWQY